MHPLLFELGPLNIYSYGVILGGAYFLAFWYALRRARRAGLNELRIMDLGFVGIVSAVVGAKLMLLVVDFDRYARDPAALMGLMWVGGVFYGGLLLAVPMCWWYIRRNGLPLWTTCDLFAPGIALAGGDRSPAGPSGPTCCSTAWPGSSSSCSAATPAAWSSTPCRPRSSSLP